MKFQQNQNLCSCAAIRNVAHPGSMPVALVQTLQVSVRISTAVQNAKNPAATSIAPAKPKTQPTCPWYSAAEDLSVSGTSGITFLVSGRIRMLTSRVCKKVMKKNIIVVKIHHSKNIGLLKRSSGFQPERGPFVFVQKNVTFHFRRPRGANTLVYFKTQWVKPSSQCEGIIFTVQNEEHCKLQWDTLL